MGDYARLILREDKNYGKKAGVRRGTLAGACRAGVHLHGQERIYMAL